MAPSFNRRDFVKTSASAVIGLGGLNALAKLSPASAQETKLLPEDVRLTADVELLVSVVRELGVRFVQDAG